ncbi:MAG: hypothetical protein ACRCUT_02175 [Spirochaetota bacterium]
MTQNTIVFYKKSSTREIRIYQTIDMRRSMRIGTESDPLSHSRLGGISRPLNRAAELDNIRSA